MFHTYRTRHVRSYTLQFPTSGQRFAVSLLREQTIIRIKSKETNFIVLADFINEQRTTIYDKSILDNDVSPTIHQQKLFSRVVKRRKSKVVTSLLKHKKKKKKQKKETNQSTTL